MPKFDGKRYPNKLTAEQAVELAKILANEFNGEAQSEEAFAQALGHSTSNSGSFIKKVADARNYGIFPTRGLKITSLGQRVANPRNEKERRQALFEMYDNVSVLSELYDHLDGREPPNKLWSILIEISDAERNEAKDAEEDILELYESMLEYDAEESKEFNSQQPESQSNEEENQPSQPEPTPSVSPESEIYLKVGNDEHKFGDLSEINIEIAQKILESKKKEVSASVVGDGSEDKSEIDKANLQDFS